MDRVDYSAIECAFEAHPSLTLIATAFSQNAIEIFAQTFSHLVGSAIGKGYGDDLIDVEVFVFAQDVEIPLDQDSGFARAGTSRHRDVLLDLVRRRCLFRL